MTYRDVVTKMHFYYERKTKEYQDAWERTRMQSYYIVLMNSDGKKAIKVTDVMKFPWDEDPKPSKDSLMTADELKEVMKRHKLID